MAQRAEFDKIEVFLIRVLQTLITERSVSRAAMRLHSTQPAVSAQLKRLRTLTGDPLLVRSGNGMVPTETALQLLAPAARMLQDADRLFGAHASQRGFEPLTSTAVFRIAASDLRLMVVAGVMMALYQAAFVVAITHASVTLVTLVTVCSVPVCAAIMSTAML